MRSTKELENSKIQEAVQISLQQHPHASRAGWIHYLRGAAREEIRADHAERLARPLAPWPTTFGPIDQTKAMGQARACRRIRHPGI